MLFGIFEKKIFSISKKLKTLKIALKLGVFWIEDAIFNISLRKLHRTCIL